MKKYLLLIVFFTLTLQNKAQTVTDVDGNVYNTVTIATQIWMKENLKTTKYNNGTAIPNITIASAWSILTTSAYCNYNNTTNTDTINIYGRLYNWYTIDTGKLCPTGWHVPDSSELITLVTYLGGYTVAGGKLKEAGLIHWDSPNTGADNSTDFTALPSGISYPDGGFYGLGRCIYLWSSSDMPNVIPSADIAYSVSMSNGSGSAVGGKMNDVIKNAGLSVRCLKDSNVSSAPIIENLGGIYFYPNPATDKLYIDNNRFPNTFVIIFDLNGKEIITTRKGINIIDVSGLQNGIYIVKIIDSGRTMIGKLIKE